MNSQTKSNDLISVLARLDRLTNWEQRPRGDMRVSLDPMHDLMQRLGDPHKRFRAVHVTGTKGKGSVCSLLEAALVKSGLKTGRYSSPHLESVTERVSIGQQPVEESRFANTLGRTIDAYERAVAEGSDGSRATWFDVLTAAAFVTFAEARLDWVIVEVGLGGRLDSTNVVDGDIAVVTNVELEHTEVLGTTRAEIAGEKIGILKPGATLVTTLSANDLAGQVAQMYADRLKCRVLRAENVSPTTIDEINATLARLVLDELGRRKILAPAYHQYVGGELLDNVTRGAARLPGRMEIVSVNDSGRAAPSLVVLDGAHVPFNIEAVLRDLSQDPRLHGPKVVLVALAADKKASGFMQKLAGDGDSIICTTLPGTVKSHHPAELARSISSSTPSIVENWSEALTCALDRTAATGQWLLVTGSLHLVGQVRRTLLGAAARRI